MIQISADQRTFEQDGTPFFYLADTCWSAFTNITEDEWDFYLKRRKQQGFNTLQINILPQWDACKLPGSLHPFQIDEAGNYDYTSVCEAYFSHAASMCEKAVAQGFTLALVVLWCNYVPDTWAYRLFQKHPIPLEAISGYVQKIKDSFERFSPIYIISGDTDFSAISQRYYIEAASCMRRACPSALLTTHIKGRYTTIPKELDELIDFYMYQSGHNALPENQGMSYRLAQQFYKEKSKKPILNSEPCYEQMGSSGGLYYRFSCYDVRKAAWQSILSGAVAGIAYGAAGIYSWQKVGYHANLSSEGFDQPNTWNQAMDYPGAWEYGFLKQQLSNWQIQELIPYPLTVKSPEITSAITPDERMLLVYIPYATTIKLPVSFQNYHMTYMDLEHKWLMQAEIQCTQDDVIVSQHPFTADALLIVEK